VPDKQTIKYPVVFEKIETVHQLLRWISESQRGIDWDTEAQLCEMVTVAMVKIRSLNY